MQMKVNAMALFYVYQNQTYQHEHDGGYVWSPQRAKSGGENQGYKIMTEICKGDSMNFLALGLFAAGLILCLLFHVLVLYALAFGYIVFFCYGRHCHLSVKELLTLSWQGRKTIRMVLIVFCLIGLITVTWRASGTIPFLVYQAGQFIRPNAFLLLTFLLNCMLSVLIGTSFGTAATMGVICMSIGNVMGCSPVLLSGAVLSGIYFGDRCSPLSTSALVVATITKTNLFTIYLYLQPLWSWLRSCKA